MIPVFLLLQKTGLSKVQAEEQQTEGKTITQQTKHQHPSAFRTEHILHPID
jgi:hypothetical protein